MVQPTGIWFNNTEDQGLRGGQTEVFKIANGYENVNINSFFSVKDTIRTRGHDVNEWERLSADCVGASSVNMFKNKIDIYLRMAGYT